MSSAPRIAPSTFRICSARNHQSARYAQSGSQRAHSPMSDRDAVRSSWRVTRSSETPRTPMCLCL